MTLIRGARVVVKTEYLDVVKTTYSLPEPRPRQAGGAILADGANIIVASSTGTFALVTPGTSWTYEAGALPPLPDLGQAAIKASKRYHFQELLPRVHGLAKLAGSYFVTYDRYSAVTDEVSYGLAELKAGAKSWAEVWHSTGIDAPYYALGGGGVMAASPSGDRLYFAVGDYSLDTINHLPTDIAAQNPHLGFGKVGYLEMADRSIHLYTLGHRNPLGLVTLADGRLLESENGPKGGDELNVLEDGKNYGWPYEGSGTHYGSDKPYRDDFTVPAGLTFQDPMYVWSPAIAPTQLVQVSGFDPRWDGNILLGSLSGPLFDIKLARDRVLFCEPIAIGERVRDLVQFGKSFVLLTDSNTLVELKK